MYILIIRIHVHYIYRLAFIGFRKLTHALKFYFLMKITYTDTDLCEPVKITIPL